MNKRKEYSKTICTLCITLFIITGVISFVCSFVGIGEGLFPYLIPSTGTLAAASVGFYYNKAKSENLSKQKLRNVVLKLALEARITESDYYEIIEEIENIDATVEAKLNSMYEDSINKEQDVEVI